MKQLPYDYSRCHPKWPFPYCATCARNMDNVKNWPEWRPMSVADFSQDDKGDQKAECEDRIEGEA